MPGPGRAMRTCIVVAMALTGCTAGTSSTSTPADPTTAATKASTPTRTAPIAAPTPPPGGPAPTVLQGFWTDPKDPTINVMLLPTVYLIDGGHDGAKGQITVQGSELDFFEGEACGLDLPDGIGRYRWSVTGELLTLHELAVDPCERESSLNGITFTRGTPPPDEGAQ